MAHLMNAPHYDTFASSSASKSSTSTSASPNTNSNNKYDVFINHRGSEVKKTLASHLSHRLRLHGFQVFLEDQPEMQAGDDFTCQMKEAIATASLHVAIFSKKYAESKWCLNELLLMLKSKATVIPVFFHVKPSDLRIRTSGTHGVYLQALRNHEEDRRSDPQTVENWRKALSAVSFLEGFDLETFEGDEGDLVDRVVQRAEEEVTKPQFHVAKYPTGLDEKLEDFIKTVLSQQQHRMKTKFVGIVGSGGVGKTTLAREFFNCNRSDYPQSCFLNDVREAADGNFLQSLQNQLIKDLTSFDPEIVSVPDGKRKLSSYLSSSRALIILDDVDDVEQLDAFLLPGMDVLRSGSLILVTSRDKDVLVNSGIGESSIYKLTGLDREHAQELFCLHAFHRRRPVIGFEAAVTKFLDVCDGLPLSLKALGALVYQKDLKYWKAPLRKISLVLPTDIQSTLKISYDGLDDQEKEIFLDMACFLIKEDRDMVIKIGDASGWEGRLNLENLESKCLVEIDSQNCIKMHGHLRDLGRELAEKEPPSFHRRLWRPADNPFRNAFQPLTVRGINMVQVRSGSSVNNPMELSNSFVDMTRLQLLRAEGDCLESISNLLEHSDLLWLRWNRYPYTSIPSWIPIRNLRVLQVGGDQLETLWESESEAPLELGELIIDAALLRLPNSIGQLMHLEKMELRCAIETLPVEFFHLSALRHLRLSTNMEVLPNEFANLTNLQHLNLNVCNDLQMLPDSFGNLTNLRDLHLSGCGYLKWLPDSFGNLTHLQHLHLSGCGYLKRLPDSFGNLTNLQDLHLSGCGYLKRLPDSFGNLTSLQDLHLSGCGYLKGLPDSFGNLTNLQDLHLSGCGYLKRLPNSFGNLTNLQDLHLAGCSDLRRLPESLGNFTSLRNLDLSMCSHLQMLPDSFGNLTNLRDIDLSGCSRSLVEESYIPPEACLVVELDKGDSKQTRKRSWQNTM